VKLQPSPRMSERAVVRLPVRSISPSPYQPRRIFSEASLGDLAESIRQHGQLSPLLVRRIGPEQYELIAGERRMRALELLGRTHADALILSAYDDDCALIALVENLQREQLHYLDEAEAYRNILHSRKLTQEALARSLAISASALANRLRLLKLPDSVRSELRSSGLSERHARALLRLNDENAQLQLIQEAKQQIMSVKQLEGRIERLLRSSERQSCGKVKSIIRDNRLIVNAFLDTVRELRSLGVHADSQVEELEDGVQVIVTIRRSSRHPQQ